ncbi:MAG: MinD/ParA family protein, partial [Deltaproteobacteria bacterium]|nr:MinD/ParA family protein [Deltaproteobacteria bacterium]
MQKGGSEFSKNRESKGAIRVPGGAMKAVTRVVSFTSGKGGVGKTNTVVNTAIALARMGRS